MGELEEGQHSSIEPMVPPQGPTPTSSPFDRQMLLAAIPEEWEAKFKEELRRSPLLKLVTLQVSQQCLEAYRQRLEVALVAGEIQPQGIHSPCLTVKLAKDGNPIVTRSGEAPKPTAATEAQIEQRLKELNFWESSASYMWFDLTKLAFVEMEKDMGQSALHALNPQEQLQSLYRYVFNEASDALKSNFSKVLQVYINQIVQLILNQYDLPNQPLQKLAELAGVELTGEGDRRSLPAAKPPSSQTQQNSKATPPTPTTHPDLFANGISNPFATCKLLWESVNILTQRSDLLWQADEDGNLAYTSSLKDGRGKLIFWVTDNPEAQYPEALAGEAALAVIETFDIRAACMHLIYAAHVTTLDRPWEEEFVIDDSQIAAYLGLDKRKDLTKEKRLKLIERIAEQPAQILTYLHWPQQGSIESFYVEKSRLWEVAIGYHGQRDLFGGAHCTGLTIRCRAGMWAKYFLNKRGSEEGKAFYQYGVLSKNLLQTITRIWQRSEGAARMLAWLSFKTRVSTHPVMMTTTLMEVAYGAEKLNDVQHNRDLRNELTNAWDNDLRVLSEAGWTVEFDPATYPPEIQPDWKEGGRGNNKRPKGYWEQLRSSRIQIHPPQEVAEGIAKLQRKRRNSDGAPKTLPAKRKVAPILSGEQIRTARESQGISQEELGKRLNRTKMWVSLIERDKRTLKAEDAVQLREILGL